MLFGRQIIFRTGLPIAPGVPPVSDPSKRIVVVIPTFNERGNIEPMISALLATGLNLSVCVVDDGSPDGTAQAVASMAAADDRIRLLCRAARQGIGPAYIAGFSQALQDGADYIVQMDADFSHPVEKVGDLVASMPEYDLVIGSRYLNGIAERRLQRRSLERRSRRSEAHGEAPAEMEKSGNSRRTHARSAAWPEPCVSVLRGEGK